MKVLINSLNQKGFVKVKEGDYVGLTHVGAYGMSLSSNYNIRPMVAEVMVTGSNHKLIRKKTKFRIFSQKLIYNLNQMLLIRSLIFNLFLYTGIVLVFLIAIPTLLMPPKFALFFGKFLGHYVVFIVRFFLNTKVEFKGTENIPKTKKYFVASAHQSMFETFALQSVLELPGIYIKKRTFKNTIVWTLFEKN